jgi:hypothetical protein
MLEGFASPTRRHRMLQIIHGFPKGEALAETLDYLVDHGYGGVVCNVGFDGYLESEPEWAHFLHGIGECRRRGLRVWLYDERGYPSGKAGTVVLRGHPEYEARGLVCARTDGRENVRHTLPADDRMERPALCAVACPVTAGGALDLRRAVDLTGQASGASELVWEGHGDWAVLSFHVRRMREGTHIVCNYSDDYPYINILDARAVARFVEVTHEAYAARMGGLLAEAVEAVFTDEPSLMTLYLTEEPGLLPAVPYADGLLERFRARYGYGLELLLPALYAECVDGAERVRVDFWSLVAEMVEDGYYGQIEQWCEAHGVQATGHALTEEHLWWHVGFEGDLYRALRRMHVPGVDQLNSSPTELVRAECLPIEKIASSVAHVRGAQMCMSETSSHCQRMAEEPLSDDQRFGAINFQYALGVNQITSYYGLREMAPDMMRQFNDHIGRLGTLLTGGVHIAPVGVYYPIHTAWAGFQATARTAYQGCSGPRAEEVSRTLSAVSRQLLWNQIDFDYLDDEAVSDGAVDHGRLVVRAEAYRAIVLPGALVIPLATYRKLVQFVDAGGALVACGALPDLAATDGDDAEVRELTRRLRQHVRVEVLDDAAGLADALSYFLPRDLAAVPSTPDLLYVHRLSEGRHVYFVTNCGDQPWSGELTLSLRGTPSLLVPRTAETRPLTCQHGVCGTTLTLSLEPYEGVAVVYEPGARSVVDEDAAGCCAGQLGHCGKCCAGGALE